MRGASKVEVYDGARLDAIPPTRLFVDAKTPREWRQKGFFPVVNESVGESWRENLEKSPLYRMLQMKRSHPQPQFGQVSKDLGPNTYRKAYCPSREEMPTYVTNYPHAGMPFGLPNLTEDEYQTLVLWIAQGSRSDERPLKFKRTIRRKILQWENLFNQEDMKSQLVARYLYEHLFLAHIYLKKGSKRQFYRMVRSRTPSGKPIDEIATDRPFDSPGTTDFYYRLKPIHSTIVAKNHLVYEFSRQRYKRFQELFFKPIYDVMRLPSYDPKTSANPFQTFAAIPARSRAQFFMDNPKFFVESFIKGPVCRGQVALNVIEDQFWVFFVDPKKDVSVTQPYFVQNLQKYGRLPAEHQSEIKVLSIWTDYWQQQQSYMKAKEPYMRSVHSKDERHALSHFLVNKKSALTVFRHSDSASVREGLWGHYPETAWVLDYPLFEKIHYLLVAGFNVYGGVGHQLNTRLYMDFLRLEGENNFLSFLPQTKRKELRQEWYRGLRASLVQRFSSPVEWTNIASKVHYTTAFPKVELFQRLEKAHFKADQKRDPVNRCFNKRCLKFSRNKKLARVYRELDELAQLRGQAIASLPDMAFLRVRMSKREDRVFTIIRNEAYKNVSFFLQDEDERGNEDVEGDTLSIVEGFEGTYPNFFFEVDARDISQFVSDFQSRVSDEDTQSFLGRYGVRRTSPSFWKSSDWFYKKSLRMTPVSSGVFDLNRYSNP